jgi:hypothetical protein
MGAAFGPEAVKGFKAIHEFLDDKATIGVIGHEFQQIARSVRDTAAEIAEIIGYAKSFNEWWLGTNKKPEEKSEVVPPMNRWWNNLGVKDAITQGFLEALRQNSAGTYTPMAFHPGGGSSRGGGYFGSKDYPAVGGNAGANPMSGGGIVPDDAGAGTNAVVTGAGTGINRDKWAAQLRANPALRDKLYRRALGENSNPMANQAVMEEAANRADIRGNKSFDDHGNLKYFQGYYGGRISAKQREMLDSNFAKVFDQGSDISKGAIDNSSQWLSLKHERTGRFRTTANFGGDWDYRTSRRRKFSGAGHGRVRSWREIALPGIPAQATRRSCAPADACGKRIARGGSGFGRTPNRASRYTAKRRKMGDFR